MTQVFRPSVLAVARDFITRVCREGLFNFMYCDVHDPPLVTTGGGNLIDPFGPAVTSLPWRYRGGGLAGVEAVRHEWQMCKDAGPAAKEHNYGWPWWQKRALLELPPEAVTKLFDDTVLKFGQELLRDFRDLDQRCADEQLALLGMAWGLGPRFRHKYPSFSAGYDARDLLRMARECGMRNPYHDVEDATCLRNAAWVYRHGAPPSVLQWPLVRDPPRRGPHDEVPKS